MKVQIHKLVYTAYSVARVLARTTGIHRILRRSVGPVAGRLVFRSLAHGGLPLEIQGQKMLLAPQGRYPSPDMVADRYEPATTRLFREVLAPGMVVVDIGANVGYFSLLAADLVGPSGKVYAVEPEPQNNAILRKNVDLNSYSNVRVIEKAISNYTGSVQLFLSALDNGSHSISDAAARGVASEVQVAATTLDDLLEQEGWPQVDLVKIDVEGAEMLVLEGMTLLPQYSPQVKLVIEYCPFLLHASGINPIHLLDKITGMDFHIEFIDENKGVLSSKDVDHAEITGRLLKQETYMNILCSMK